MLTGCILLLCRLIFWQCMASLAENLFFVLGFIKPRLVLKGIQVEEH